jgi:hypothetical protein
MWRIYQKRDQRSAWAGSLSQAHYFPGGPEYTRPGSSRTLCGRWVSLDYQNAQPPRPMMAECFYCKRCRALLARGQHD